MKSVNATSAFSIRNVKEDKEYNHIMMPAKIMTLKILKNRASINTISTSF